MKFSITSHERMAGIFLAVSVLLVTAFIAGAAVRHRWFSPRVRYHTLLTRGDGLSAGAPILLSGIDIGYIGDITIRDDDRVDVELVIQADSAGRIRRGIQAAPRRVLGIGDKRMHLVPQAGATEVLPPGSVIPATEPMELLDVAESIDFGLYLRTMDRTLSSLDRNLTRLDENGRVDHLFEILDRLAPLLDHLDGLVTDAGPPLTAFLKEPALPQAVRGMATLTNDADLYPMIRNAKAALDGQRMDQLLSRAEEVFGRIDRLTAEDGHLEHLLATSDRVLSDGRADRLATSLEHLADEKKLGALVDHLGVLADEMSRVGPEIPALTKDLHATLREAVVVLKALQETWILQGEAKKARVELGR